MGWVREGTCLPPAQPGDADAGRAWRPWVLEEDDGSLRMWYSGHDGTSWSILEATKAPGKEWRRLGAVIAPGFAGDSDDYGVQAPCVVRTQGGYLMAYGGLDGEVARLHMASSLDGDEWTPLGTFLQRGEEDTAGANNPCMLVTANRWWLYYDGTTDDGEVSILAAVSESGASWDRLGPVLAPDAEEVTAGHACVVSIALDFHMFHASDQGERSGIALATSRDGVNWDRRGIILAPTGEGPDGLATHTPCVVRRGDGSLRMWYAGRPMEDIRFEYRICTARFEEG